MTATALATTRTTGARSTLALKPFQQKAVDTITEVIKDTAGKITVDPSSRRGIALAQGTVLLRAPTGSGKTLMAARALESVCGTIRGRTVWFWFTPFSGLVTQTTDTIKAQATGLRIRDIKTDRVASVSRDGDIFVSTWGLVATGRKDARKVRTEDDDMASLDQMLDALRADGFHIGAVIDEAHVNFGTSAKQAAAFYLDVLKPDFTLLATATPKDAALEDFCKAAGIKRVNRIEIDRETVVNARLNKLGIRAVYFRPDVRDENLLDSEEVAIEAGLRQHERIRLALRTLEIPLTPLLLIQVDDQRAGAADPIEKVRTFLKRQSIDPARVAVHTSGEPDPYFHTLAYDESKDILVFKVAVATGFDAPRAWTLVSLRASRGIEFGLQIIGRIMRVHPRVQAIHGTNSLLDNGYVFLSNPEQQAGLSIAASEIKAVRAEIATVTDNVTVIDFGKHTCTILNRDDGFLEPLLGAPVDPPSSQANAAMGPAAQQAVSRVATLHAVQPFFLGDLPLSVKPVTDLTLEAQSHPVSGNRLPGYVAYELRGDLPFPRCLAREVMPKNMNDLVSCVAATIAFDERVIALVQRRTGKVHVTEAGMFESDITRREEQFALSDERIMLGAQMAFAFNDSLDMRRLMPALMDRLKLEIGGRGFGMPSDDELARGISLAVMMFPHLLHDACRACLARSVSLLQDEPIPDTIWGLPGLEPAARSLYRVFPHNLNKEEEAFARLLDGDTSGTVEWWLRNIENTRWAVSIVLPTGKRHYPDFVIGVRGRKSLDHIALAEIKDDEETGRLNSSGNTDKVRTEHAQYGSALMVTRDVRTKDWYQLAYFPDLRRHQPAALFKVTDLVWTK